MAETRFKWNEELQRFPNGPARVLLYCMRYLKKAQLVILANECWKEKGHGGFPHYGGDIELWRAPSAAWNEGDLESRRILVRLGHSQVIRFRQYGGAYNDVLNMEALGILGDVEVDYNITLDEAIERQRDRLGHGNGNDLNDDLM